jgi:folate-binding protein YgfZ
VVAASADATATYRAGRETALLLDSGSRPRLLFEGSARSKFLHRITTGDINALTAGQVAPTLLITGKGRLMDRLMVLCRDEQLILIGSAGSGDLARETLSRYVVFDDVQITDLTPSTCLLALQGPQAAATLEAAGGPAVTAGTHGEGTLAGLPVTVSTEVGLDGPGWMIQAAAEHREALMTHLLAAGTGLVRAEASGWEALRVEAGLVASGNELSEAWNPLEMRQEDALSFDKGCYVGQEVIARLRTYDRVKRRLWRVVFIGEKPLPVGTRVHAAPGEGVITSSAGVPGEDRNVALAVLPGDDPAPGGEVIAMTDAGERLGEIVGPPPTHADMRAAPPEPMARRRFGN